MIEPKTVVVVDDDIKVTALVENALMKRGFRVFSANEGIKALGLVENEKPDVLITDILQPGLDGVSLCNTVKKNPALSNTKVILISGVYNEASLRLQMDCRPDGFIEKPFDIHILIDLIIEKINNYVDGTKSKENLDN